MIIPREEMTMKKLFVLAFGLLFAGGMLLAGERTGTLIDAMCGQKAAPNAEKVAGHKVSCAKMDNCKESGYGLVADGKFIKFDAAGDEKAWALLEKTAKTNDLKVKVTGTLEGDTFKVTSIEEVK